MMYDDVTQAAPRIEDYHDADFDPFATYDRALGLCEFEDPYPGFHELANLSAGTGVRCRLEVGHSEKQRTSRPILPAARGLLRHDEKDGPHGISK
jgi:hypothetical protein